MEILNSNGLGAVCFGDVRTRVDDADGVIGVERFDRSCGLSVENVVEELPKLVEAAGA